MITQPQSITLPEDVQRAVDSARQNISVAEIELVNIKKARISEEYTVSELVKQKKELSEQTETLQSSLQTLTNTLDGLKSVITELEKKKSDLDILIAKQSFELRTKEEDITAREQTVKESELWIENQTAKINQGISELEAEKVKHVEYVNRIKAVL